jgi:hypothetical protein
MPVRNGEKPESAADNRQKREQQGDGLANAGAPNQARSLGRPADGPQWREREAVQARRKALETRIAY